MSEKYLIAKNKKENKKKSLIVCACVCVFYLCSDLITTEVHYFTLSTPKDSVVRQFLTYKHFISHLLFQKALHWI